MKIAGIGLRAAATLADLQDALVLAGCARPDALATLSAKADKPQIMALAEALNVPVIRLQEDQISGISTLTCSPRIKARFGTGSVAEAAALAAGGTGARLICPRVKTTNGLATAAIAERTAS